MVFRFASIVGGRLRGKDVRLQVKYIAAEYDLSGVLNESGMAGNWVKADDGQEGSWEAKRVENALELSKTEWIDLWSYHGEKGFIVYRVAGEAVNPGWRRGGQPICRVLRYDRSQSDHGDRPDH